jgi:rhodanese-related sulfurtransferase
MTHHEGKVDTLDATEVARLLEAGKLLLVDVREPAEFAAERIQGALLYPLSTFDAQQLPPDGARRVVFHCAGGKRSLAAAEQRLAAGSAHATHMGGGIAAWKAAGLPVLAPTS